MNKKNELIGLFKEYIRNKNKNYYKSYNRNKSNSIIYFYEWSTVDRVPLSFHCLDELKHYLSSVDLSLDDWQITTINTCVDECFNIYISCRPGMKQLVIRTSYSGLKDALYNYEHYGVSYVPNSTLQTSTNARPADSMPYDSRFGW